MKLKTAMMVATLAIAGAAHAEDEKHFDGFYAGGEFGRTFSGGEDDIYYGAVAGARKQFDNNWVFGVEGTFGTAAIQHLDHIWTVKGTAGYVFGSEKRDMVFVGFGYVEAKASGNGISVKGSDVSSMFGYERAMGSNISLRVKADIYSDDTIVPSVGVAFRF
ncbi:MAG: hypothetical protein EP335_02845 [Alphaproteobacteria bacterium]|nr:MAG: hypothetical protein EP335_02845 [Alphaproteobacteria bacterium]